jgi:phage terminase small subunit
MTKPQRPQTRPMSHRQCLFVSEYLIDFNAKQAAIRAGYPAASAANRGWELLHECAPVMQRIEAALAERERRTQIAADRVLKEIARIAFSDIRHYVTWGKEEGFAVRPPAQWSDDDSAAVAEIRAGGPKGAPRGIKLHDKQTALELLCRHLGLIGKRRDSAPAWRAPDTRDARAILRERLMRYAAEAVSETDETAAPAALPAQTGG